MECRTLHPEVLLQQLIQQFYLTGGLRGFALCTALLNTAWPGPRPCADD